ncbi:uncharacterized protein K444DRAFT_386229 [Hyaloscypha bicolor E]|uniref:Uncharacterized protein n=1 Tax=Hyaloscypha bicolor E TaxID=1095630 RepID=A0A2J6TC20_9HELO|nr:uncharacterized protein K444DRAFT_386229 [Hyaloscypha bicolor E]PMD60577.1 hypothetical protein K444DRAFT_386229 [Hyaloscypha bicolor E]
MVEKGDEAKPPNRTHIHDPRFENLPELWYKIHVLIFDLRSYQTNTGSRDRLEIIVDPSYIGSPYFTSCEVAIIKFPPNRWEQGTNNACGAYR